MYDQFEEPLPEPGPRWWRVWAGLICVVFAGVAATWAFWSAAAPDSAQGVATLNHLQLRPRDPKFDTSGFQYVILADGLWETGASLSEIRERWTQMLPNLHATLEHRLEDHRGVALDKWLGQARCFSYEGKPERAYELMTKIRQTVMEDPNMASAVLADAIVTQGVLSLRQGENENCILCRGESSCILPISGAAIHKYPEGSRRAIKHFLEYLEHFPDDMEVRWLLNLAHMTLGEHPEKVDPRYLISLDPWFLKRTDIGKFRDIGHLVGVNRFNQSGGAIMDDFDNDGLLDIFVTSFDYSVEPVLYRNQGNGHFEASGADQGLSDQWGGLVCTQTDFNNDGLLDVYITRGAWFSRGVRGSLLRNDGGGKFTDVTAAAGLDAPVNSNSSQWADYDNDGWLDLFVCCERSQHHLYHNLQNGTFAEVTEAAGLSQTEPRFGKGCTWFDYDNDDFPDLFINNLQGPAQLYHNNRDGTFSDVTRSQRIEGPNVGFACWAWDYDNDGWLDLFATCYESSVTDVLNGLVGQPNNLDSSRLYHNRQGQGFEDQARLIGLDLVFDTMGCNYGDFDNDGYLDMYLGTGDPNLSTLVPNRMLLNRNGKNFVEVSAEAGVAHLQKGHGVACGDWDRDGNVDIFIEMGGATNGDMYHNILFQNPGHAANWITVKLIGQKTNRAAMGARIKVVTAGDNPLTVHRHVSPGGSFGSNPLEQTIGIGAADKIETLEIHWPTSGTTQVFHDVPLNKGLEITEFAENFRVLDWQPLTVPK